MAIDVKGTPRTMLRLGPFGWRIDPCGIQSTDDNQYPAMATEPRELRSGKRKPSGGRGGSDHSCHGRVECVLAGVRTKNVEHRFGGGGASSVRGRGGEDCAQAVFVDRQEIQRVRNLIAGRNDMPGEKKPGLAAADRPGRRHA